MANTTVIYDVDSDAPIESVGVEGELRFDSSRDTRLHVTHLLVYRTGALEIGAPDAPVSAGSRAMIVINDSTLETGSAADPGRDPFQYGVGVLVWGRFVIYGSRVEAPFLRLAQAPEEGDESLRLLDPATHWGPGDRIFLPDSRQLTGADVRVTPELAARFPGTNGMISEPHDEIAIIQAVTGTALQLEKPLRYDHPGLEMQRVVAHPEDAMLLPHVAHLDRNVVFTSENPGGTRGHMIFFHGASIDINHASFKELGRTTVDHLDNTTFDRYGNIVKIGSNQIARYPVHFHHLNDAKNLNGEPAFRFQGNVVEESLRWAVVVHGSHFGLVRDNVVVRFQGAGIVTEDGSETGNVIESNFAAAATGTGIASSGRREEYGLGHEGAGFWFASDNNLIRGNISAGTRGGGLVLFRPEGARGIPEVRDNHRPLSSDSPRNWYFEFANNEAYGSAGPGVDLWSTKKCRLCKDVTNVIDSTTVWATNPGIRFDYHADYYKFRDVVIVQDETASIETVGIEANHSKYPWVENVRISGSSVGVLTGGSRNRGFNMIDGEIVASKAFRIQRGTSWAQKQITGIVLKNIRVQTGRPLANSAESRLIEFDNSRYGSREVKFMLRRPVYVIGLQGNSVQNFEVFQEDQEGSVIAPYNDDPAAGCPEANLSNTECLRLHGLTTGGKIAPCGVRREDSDGFWCPLSPSQAAMIAGESIVGISP